MNCCFRTVFDCTRNINPTLWDFCRGADIEDSKSNLQLLSTEFIRKQRNDYFSLNSFATQCNLAIYDSMSSQSNLAVYVSWNSFPTHPRIHPHTHRHTLPAHPSMHHTRSPLPTHSLTRFARSLRDTVTACPPPRPPTQRPAPPIHSHVVALANIFPIQLSVQDRHASRAC